MDYDSRRRWFRSHPAAHYALGVAARLIVGVGLTGIFIGFSWPGMLYRAVSGVVLGLFVIWNGRRQPH
ncbi:MAG TPA: hypothetical protein VFW96_08290 [Thermomicrobiales bacterium]|nr:hypothetical protein [Thermomicrobiales bacterium]